MRRLFYDIEVSPNKGSFWQPGYKLNIDYRAIREERAVICIGYMWEWDSNATVISWDRNQCDKKILKEFSRVIRGADECVGHNIDRFDLPWIRTRAMFHRIDPIPPAKTADTLQWARKYFKFNSNRLDYLARFLGIGCKIRTENDLWDAVCWDDDRAALGRMEKYCAHDVELTPQVYKILAEYGCPPKTHVGVLNGGEKWSCPKCGSYKVGPFQRCVTAAGSEQMKMQCKKCGGYYRISAATLKQFQEAA